MAFCLVYMCGVRVSSAAHLVLLFRSYSSFVYNIDPVQGRN